MQFIYSFTPAAWAYYITNSIIWAPELTSDLVVSGFSSLLAIQLGTWAVDLFWSKKRILPRWYAKHRMISTTIQILATLGLFYIYYKYPKCIQPAVDSNRLTGIKSAEQLELEEMVQIQQEYEECEGVDLDAVLSQARQKTQA